MLSELGTFKDKMKLKRLAREGQSMSSSTHVMKFQPNQFALIEDVENSSFNYSDGSGYAAT